MPAPIIILTGPPGAGKTTVAQLVADGYPKSVVIEGDAFFRFLHNGKVPPWLPESHEQNTTVTSATVGASVRYARDGWTTVLEGIFGSWFLPVITTHIADIDVHYLVLQAPLQTCVDRFSTRESDTNPAVVAKMHSEFDRAAIDQRHLIAADGQPPTVAAMITQRVADNAALIRGEG